jgi:hypothetical protein
MISIDGYCAKAQELGYLNQQGEWTPNGAVEHLAKQVESLRARVAELEKDAKRYHLIREAQIEIIYEETGERPTEAMFDAEIDEEADAIAAMKEGK